MLRKSSLQSLVALWRRLALFTFMSALAVIWVVLDSSFSLLPDPSSRSVEIPDYRGLAVSDLEFAAWLSVSTEYLYDADSPAGTVLSQFPLAGSFRRLSDENPSCDLTLTVSLGNEPVIMPDVVGLDVRSASSLLSHEGFLVSTVPEFCSRPAGEVLSASEPAGRELPKGTKITLFVSTYEE